MTLSQSILTLNWANSGIIRPTLSDESVTFILTFKPIQLFFSLCPLGYSIRNKNSSYEFRL